MTPGRKAAWRRLGAPAAVSVLLGVAAALLVSQASAAGAGLSAALGATAAVGASAAWEGWRAVRSAGEDNGPVATVIQVAGRVQGRLLGWSGPISRRLPTVHQQIDTIESGGEVIGVEARGSSSGPPTLTG
jgi:hypothetical protein